MTAAGSRAALAALVLVYGAHALWLEGVAEDAFISFRFARHLAEGQGLVWNLGEPPVEGFTNFLWVALLGGALRLGLDAPLTAQLLGVTAGAASLVAAWWAAGLLRLPAAARLLPPLFLALSGPFATWATGGLETTLFALLLLLGAGGVLGGRGPRARGCGWGAFGLAMAARPGGALFTAIAVALCLRRRERAQLAPAACALGLFALYFAWRWSYFGYPLPNTFYAKTGGGAAQWLRGASYCAWFALHFGLPCLPLLAWARSRGAGRAAGDTHPLWTFSALSCAAYAVYLVAVGGDYMAMYRFFVPVLPFLYLLLAGACAASITASRRPALPAALVALAALGTAVHSTPLSERLYPKPPLMHGNYRGVQTERWHVARLATIARFFAAYARPGESLATDAIGVIGYATQLRVHGVHGLVDPEIAHRRRAGAARLDYAGHDRREMAAVIARRPTFVMVSRDLHAGETRGMALPKELAEGAGRDYRVVPVWLEDSANGEAGWFRFLELRSRVAQEPQARGPGA